MNKIKLAIAPIGWSNDDMPELGGDISFAQCIQEMSAAGYQGCEAGHKFPRDPVILNAALAPYQLSVASAWYSLYFTELHREQETIDGFIQHMHFLKAMGAKVIVVCECGNSIQGKPLPIFAAKPVFSTMQWQCLLAGLDYIGQLAQQHNMCIVYHPHMGTGVQQQSEIDYLMSETNADNVSLLFDTGHITYANDDPLTLLKKHHKRIKHVHLKDIRQEILQQVKLEQLTFLASVRAGVFTVPGDGCIDFHPMLTMLIELGYEGWWVVEAEQDPEKAHPFTYAKLAREFLRKTVGI